MSSSMRKLRQAAADERFDTTLTLIRDFATARRGLLPSSGSSDAEEARLGRWLAKRRWEAKHGVLPHYRASALSVMVPNWRHTPRSDEGFAAIVEECVDWIQVNRDFPRSTGGDPAETRLGLWLVARRYDESLGRLEARRAQILDERLDGWRSSPAFADRFHRAVALCVAWRHDHERFPEPIARDSLERALGAWLAATRRAAAAGRLPDLRRAQLNTFVPGWEQRPAERGAHRPL